MTDRSPFEQNILEQPQALLALRDAGNDGQIADLAERPWDRIVFTGMGSSYYAALPTWRRLVAAGHTAWAVDAGRLLDTPGLVTNRTLVIATSQSGASGEVVELLARAERGEGWGALIGIAAAADSPLATQSDLFLPLYSGDEATVSTKSYINTLAVQRRVAAGFLGEDPREVEDEITTTAHEITPLLTLDTTGIAEATLASARPRVVTVGWGDEASTALYAALIIKESSKIAVQGFDGGEFRHGPLELAGAGLTAFIFASSSDPDSPAARIATTLVGTGSAVVLIGDLTIAGAITLPTRTGGSLAAVASQTVVAESLAVGLSRANGVVPGAFRYGSKVTSTI